MTIRNGLFSSESVSEGHPDKLADRILCEDKAAIHVIASIKQKEDIGAG